MKRKTELKHIFHDCLLFLRNFEQFLKLINPNPTAQKMKSHLLKKSLMENFIFCAVSRVPSFNCLFKKIVQGFKNFQLKIQFNGIMMPKVQERYHLLKRLNQVVDETKFFRKNKKTARTKWLSRFLQNTYSDVGIIATKRKHAKNKVTYM